VRIYLAGVGWGGPRFQLALDELKNENDKVVESEGIKLVYDSKIEAYLRGSVVDYANSWFERGFVIKGPGMSDC
jgi:iron-sulfur cluster assembly protein